MTATAISTTSALLRAQGPSCDCHERHPRKRVVLTGGPGAGKTAVLELVRRHFCEHVLILPESAGLVYGGGFPRTEETGGHRCGQRAIFHVQRELEAFADAEDNSAIVLCDRGTLDGLAYWRGAREEMLGQVGTTLAQELARYDMVIHLRTPPRGEYNHSNRLRVETPEEAAKIDARIEEVWHTHPRRVFLPSTDDFLAKAARAIELLRDQLPECCRHHADVNLSDDLVV